jgi:hypothetical protein
MRILLIVLTILLASCKMSSWYPVTGSVVGAAGGSIGGPGGAALGSGLGYATGKTAQMMSENEDLKETVNALTHGDVSKLVEQGMKQHQSGFDEFTGSIKKLLTVVGSLLLAYLCIPIFLVKKTATHCAREEAKKQYTRAPFPVKPSDYEKP